MRFLELKIPPPLVGLLCALAMWGLARLAPGGAAAPFVRVLATALLVAAGLAFDLLGLLGFRAQRTTISPLSPQRSSALVTGGVYRVTRNPMYVGMAGLLVAHAAARGQWAALIPVAGFVAYIDRFQVAAEQNALRAKFGEDYAAYVHDVPRWLDLRTFRAARLPAEGVDFP